MAIEIQDIKNKPTAGLKEAEIRLVGFNNNEFKQISTRNLVELNSIGKIPTQYLDISGLKFMGLYDALENEPPLSDSVGNNDEYYIVNVSGSQDLGSGVLVMNPNDNLIYHDNKWNLVPNSAQLLYNNDFD